jgi:hypothetical protein
MPKPYSYDLRKKAIEAIEQDGMKISVFSQLFNISRNTIDLWLKRQAETGDYQALPHQPPRNNNKIADWEKFRDFAKIHGDKTQVEMAKLWSGEISDSLRDSFARAYYFTVFAVNWLYARKKTYGYRERDEEKRQAFIAHLSTVCRSKIVYLDESPDG